jgi:hypothetical protein
MAGIGGPRGRVFTGPPQTGTGVAFEDDGSGYRGTGLNGRCWRIQRAVTGWRLEFRDPGDDEPTYAGMFGSAERAMQEANIDTTPRSRVSRG